MKAFDTKLYLITDSTDLKEDEFLAKIEEALKGGVTLVQLREKEKTTKEILSLGEKVHSLTKKYNVPLIIDDRTDIALALDLEGVHLGNDDMPVDTARKILGDKKIIGATAKTVEKAIDAYKKGADYLGVGAIYPTTTKVKTILTSVETLKEICKAVPIRVNAIGGLNKDNLDVLKGVDISGICVVSAIMKAENPYITAKELKERVNKL